MSDWVEAGSSSELADGTVKEIEIQGRKILLARVGDRYYAAAGRCPHMGGNLAQGRLDGTVVTCPRHSAQFDLRDGHNVRWAQLPRVVSALSRVIKSPRSIDVYEVKLEGDRILVKV